MALSGLYSTLSAYMDDVFVSERICVYVHSVWTVFIALMMLWYR
jgi:hypothetical protein